MHYNDIAETVFRDLKRPKHPVEQILHTEQGANEMHPVRIAPLMHSGHDLSFVYFPGFKNPETDQRYRTRYLLVTSDLNFIKDPWAAFRRRFELSGWSLLLYSEMRMVSQLEPWNKKEIIRLHLRGHQTGPSADIDPMGKPSDIFDPTMPGGQEILDVVARVQQLLRIYTPETRGAPEPANA